MTFDELIQSISSRPAMWVGSALLRDVAIFLDGFRRGIETATGQDPMLNWRDWIETKYLISDPGWHWTRILLHVYGSDAAVFAALPGLFSDFKTETSGLTSDQLSELHRQAFLAAFGEEHHRPEDPDGSDQPPIEPVVP